MASSLVGSRGSESSRTICSVAGRRCFARRSCVSNLSHDRVHTDLALGLSAVEQPVGDAHDRAQVAEPSDHAREGALLACPSRGWSALGRCAALEQLAPRCEQVEALDPGAFLAPSGREARQAVARQRAPGGGVLGGHGHTGTRPWGWTAARIAPQVAPGPRVPCAHQAAPRSRRSPSSRRRVVALPPGRRVPSGAKRDAAFLLPARSKFLAQLVHARGLQHLGAARVQPRVAVELLFAAGDGSAASARASDLRSA